MKSKKIFILLAALALSLGACGTETSSSKGGKKSNTSETSQTSDSSQGGNDTVAVTGLALNKKTLSLEATKSETLTVTVTPDNASDTSVTWSSSNEQVATVSKLGKVSALAVGTTTITVASVSNPTVTDTCEVTVTEEGGKYGSLSKPKTVAEILAIAAEECKEDNNQTADQVYVKGIVTKNPGYNAEKGYASNIYLKDALTDKKDLLVYSANCDALKLPYQNDEVVLHGYMKNYRGTIEIASVKVSGNDVNPEIDTVTRGTSKISYFITHGSINSDAPKSGKNNAKFSFTVTPENGFDAKIVTVNGEKIQGNNGVFEGYIKGDTSVAINVFESELEIVDAKMAYSGATTNMVADANNAETVGLDKDLFEVTTNTVGGNNIGLNAAGNIRLYNGYKNTADPTQGNILTVTSRRALVKRIIVTLAGSSVATLEDLEVKAGGEAVTGSNGIYEFSNGTFTLKNVSSSTVSCQLHIASVAIFYIIREEVHATGIAVAPKTAEVEAGEIVKLGATTDPANATDDIVWSSSDPSLATVDQSGVVTGVAAGEVTITAKTSETVKDTATVTVKPARVINYGTAEAPLTVAEAKAVLDEYPTKTSKQPLFVKGIVSSNTAFHETYDNSTIWLQSDDGANEQEFELYSCEIDSGVENAASYKTADALKGLEVVATGYGKIYGTTYELTNINIKDETGADQRINPKILSVGLPSAKAVGLNKDTLALAVGDEETLVASKTPANAPDVVAWSSSEPTVASVNQEGKVTALAAGTTVITAQVSETIKATCTVTVAAAAVKATSVAISGGTGALNVDGVEELTATVLPEDSTDSVVWSSSEPTVASVDPSTGKVTALAAGTTVITATAGDVHDDYNLTVTQLSLADFNDAKKGDAVNFYAYYVGKYNNAKGYFVADGNTGAYVYDNVPAGVEAGDILHIVGKVDVYSGLREIVNATVTEVESYEGLTAPTTLNITEEALSAFTVADQGRKVALTGTVTKISATPKWGKTDGTSPMYTISLTETKSIQVQLHKSNITEDEYNDFADKAKLNSVVTIEAYVSAYLKDETDLTKLAASNYQLVNPKVTAVHENPALTAIALDKESLELNVGGTAALKVTQTPWNASLAGLTWESSDAAVATVENGNVTAVAAGTATITAKISDEIKATCTVTVAGVATDVTYSLGKIGTTSSYTGRADITFSDSKIWNFPGNQTLDNGLKMGGKPDPQTAETPMERFFYSKSAYASVSSIVITHGTKDTQITVNSVKLYVYDSADKAAAGAEGTEDEVVVGTYVDGGATTFAPASGTAWANKYFRVVYNMNTTSPSSNKGIMLTQLKINF